MSSNKRNPYHGIDDLTSEFDEQSDIERNKKKRRTDFMEKERFGEQSKARRAEAKSFFQDEHSRLYRTMSKMHTLNAYQRHKEIMNLYYFSFPGSTETMVSTKARNEKTDYDVLEENHKFIWSEEDEKKVDRYWGEKIAKRYYDKLFKEYCITDLSFYQKNKYAFRWRTEKEVKIGKGQFICGNRKCETTERLSTWEVNFSYVEDERKKQALVKVRLCPPCSDKLNHSSQRKKVEKRKKLVHRWKKELTKDKTAKTELDVEQNGKDNEQSINKDQPSTSTATSATELWEGTATAEVEKTVDEDIDEFLDDLFM